MKIHDCVKHFSFNGTFACPPPHFLQKIFDIVGYSSIFPVVKSLACVLPTYACKLQTISYVMNRKSIRAHFDGEKICLDEPCSLQPNAKLIITVLPGQETDDERSDWLHVSMKGLEDAYGEDETEYSLDLIKEPNSEYELWKRAV
jgi:hypothetical protein